MVISSCYLEATNGLKNAPEAISESLKFKNFLGGHAPRPPYREHCRAQSLRPPKFSLSIILPPPPLSIFLNETLHGQDSNHVILNDLFSPLLPNVCSGKQYFLGWWGTSLLVKVLAIAFSLSSTTITCPCHVYVMWHDPTPNIYILYISDST